MCEGLALAMRRHGVPEEVLTNSTAKSSPDGSTARWSRCSSTGCCARTGSNTGCPSPAARPRRARWSGSTGRLRTEFNTARVFPTLAAAQAELDEWVRYYNTERPHQAIGMVVPAERFQHRPAATTTPDPLPAPLSVTAPDRTGPQWVARRVSGINRSKPVTHQPKVFSQWCVGRQSASSRCRLLQSAAAWSGALADCVRTASTGEEPPLR